MSPKCPIFLSHILHPCPRSLTWPQDKALISCQCHQHEVRGGKVVPCTPHPWPLATLPCPWPQPPAPSRTAARRPADTPLKPGKLGGSRGQSHPRVSEPGRPSKSADFKGTGLSCTGQIREDGWLAPHLGLCPPGTPHPAPCTHQGHPSLLKWPGLARSESHPEYTVDPLTYLQTGAPRQVPALLTPEHPAEWGIVASVSPLVSP